MNSSRKSSQSAGRRSRRALVKWLSGQHTGTFTHNLELPWIRDLDETEDYRDESHVVEWRVPPKPKSGWQLLDAKILEISDDLDFLKRRMEEEEEQEEANSRVNEKTNKRRSSSISNATPQRPRRDTNSEDLQRLFQNFFSGIPTSQTSASAEDNQVKVGEVLTISKTAYLEAKLARTPTAMTMDLIRAAFSKGRLRRSSYAGQKRVRNGVIQQKPSLKKYRKTKDIQNFVNQRFSYFSQAAFGHAVNACTGNNVDKRPVRQLVDESESEESSMED